MDPLSVLSAVAATFSGLQQSYQVTKSLLSDVEPRLRQIIGILEKHPVENIVGNDMMMYIMAILGDLDSLSSLLKHSLEDRRFGVPVGMVKAYVGSAFSCWGAALWSREIRNKLDELDVAMETFNTHVRLSIAQVSSQGPSKIFRTDTQQSFWRHRCGDSAAVSQAALADAMSYVALDPISVCQHVACGLMSGKGTASCEAVAASMGDMSPRSWVKSLIRGPSKTIAFAGHSEKVNHVAFSGDALMATSSDDRTVKIFKDLVLVSILVGHERAVVSSCFKDSGGAPVRTIFSASHDHTVRGWSIYSGKQMFSHQTGVGYPVDLVCWESGVAYAVKGSPVVIVLDEVTGDVRHSVSVVSGPVECMIATSSSVFVSGFTGRICEISSETVEVVRCLDVSHSVSRLQIFGDHLLACGQRRASLVDLVCGTSDELRVPERASAIRSGGVDGNGDMCLVCSGASGENLVLYPGREESFGIGGKFSVQDVSFAALSGEGIVQGFTDGSTVGYVRDGDGFGKSFHVVGCRFSSMYVPECSSDTRDLVVSVSADEILIGPRRSESRYASDSGHGIVRNDKRSSFKWKPEINMLQAGSEFIQDAELHVGIRFSKNPRWVTCSRVGNRLHVRESGSGDFDASENPSTICEIESSANPVALAYVSPGVVALIFRSDLDQTESIKIVRLSSTDVPHEAELIPYTRILGALPRSKAILVVVEERELALMRVVGGEKALVSTPLKLDGAFSIQRAYCACELGDRGIVVLVPGQLLYVPDAFSSDTHGYESSRALESQSIECPMECRAVRALGADRVVAFGYNGRLFVYNLKSQSPRLTYITHPSQLVHTIVDWNMVTWDSRGAIVVMEEF